MTISACGGSACIAGVSRDCGHGIFWLERGASCTQIKRATNCAIPGYLILNHYSTKFVRLKDFSVCGHLCGQSRFYGVFDNRRKSRKHRCHKALRRFTLPRPDTATALPKPGTLPTALIPDMKFRPYYRLHSDRLKLPDEIYIPDAPNPCAFKGDRGGGEAKPGDQTIRKWPTHRAKRSQNTQLLAKTQNVAERLFSILLKSSAKSSPI